MVNGAKAASRRVSPLHPGVMQSVALQLLEPGEAGLDVSHDATKFPQIALHDMWLQPSEERFDLTPVPVHEAGDVGFVNRYSVKLALPVKGGQRVEFEQDQTFRRGGRHVQLGKPVGGAEVLLRLGKEGIGSQQHIDPHAAETASAEVFVVLINGDFGELLQRRQGHEKVNVLGIPSLHVAQHGNASHEQVRNLALSKEGEEFDHIAVGGKEVLGLI